MTIKPTMILLVRHGQTQFNREGRFQGHLDSALTAQGEGQARAMAGTIGRYLRGQPDIGFWASPLGRARRTAEIIRTEAGLAADIRLDHRLAEIGLGVWDGLTDDDIEALHPGRREGSGRYDWFYLSPNGETRAEHERRLGDWLTEVLAIGGTHLAVSHGFSGGVLRNLYARAFDAGPVDREAPQDAVFRMRDGRVERLGSNVEAGPARN